VQAIRSRRVVTPDGVGPATIVFDETIRAIDEWDSGQRAVDYGDLVILPGLVDSHVHVNEPGRTEWEGFATATRAAAAGGITTIVDMPLNSIPATTTVDALRVKARALNGQCRVDVGLWGGVVPGNTAELGPMLDAGARGFKCFLVPSGVDEFPHVDAGQLREAARELARHGAPLLVHAELPGPIEEASRRIAGDPAAYETWLASRPPSAEDRAVKLLRDVCAETGCRIHIVHLSSANAIEIVRSARRSGLRLSAETTPHYLHFDAESIDHGRLEFKCAPPIREHSNRERLWRGVADEVIELIVSDHSPCTPELKQGGFLNAWGGISSVQFVLPVIWTEANARGFGVGTVARWLSEGPARLASLAANKGAIAVGRDADFAIFAPEETFVVEAETIEHRHKVTPYAGETLSGVVRETWLRGQQIFAGGKHAGPARGRLLATPGFRA
jgi:allantoinase